MKTLTILTIALLLSACSMLGAPKFDSHEYEGFAVLHTHAVYLKEECGVIKIHDRLIRMKFESTTLLTYATHIPNNKEITEIAIIIDNDIKELIERNLGALSQTYCQLKAKQLLIKLDDALDSIGALN